MDLGPIGEVNPFEQSLIAAMTEDEALLAIADVADDALLPEVIDAAPSARFATALALISRHARRVYSERDAGRITITRKDDADDVLNTLNVRIVVTKRDILINRIDKAVGALITAILTFILASQGIYFPSAILFGTAAGVGTYALYADMTAQRRFDRAVRRAQQQRQAHHERD